MFARRFLIFITILTLLVVAGAFAMFQFGGSVLRQQFTPRGHYTAPPAQTGPDYAQPGSWIARPDMDERSNPAQWRPGGYPPPRAVPKRAAVFFVHPTTYLSGDRWNAPLDLDSDTQSRTRLFVESQASAFNTAGDVWAPRYRQAAYGAFLLNSSDAQQALDLAYSDIAAAFDEFLRHLRPEQGIILAGHSQGALHLIRLLEERHRQLNERLIAAYVVGWPIDRQADLPALGYPACSAPGQPGCILSWMSFGDPPNPALILAGWTAQAGLTGGERRQQQIVCVNPITGRANGSAPASANQGTLVPNGDFSTATLAEGAVGAHCDDGLLIIGGAVPQMGPFVLPGNNYHVYDYALFWGPIARDASLRTDAWRSR